MSWHLSPARIGTFSLRVVKSQSMMPPPAPQMLILGMSVAPPAAKAFASGLKATESALPHGPISHLQSGSMLPEARSHSFTVPSILAEASSLPSGLKTTETVPHALRVDVFFPLATSHTRIVSSMLPEASDLPSGLKATDRAPAPLNATFS